jgi:hypothetical protein
MHMVNSPSQWLDLATIVETQRDIARYGDLFLVNANALQGAARIFPIGKSETLRGFSLRRKPEVLPSSTTD